MLRHFDLVVKSRVLEQGQILPFPETALILEGEEMEGIRNLWEVEMLEVIFFFFQGYHCILSVALPPQLLDLIVEEKQDCHI